MSEIFWFFPSKFKKLESYIFNFEIKMIFFVWNMIMFFLNTDNLTYFSLSSDVI